MHRRIFVVSSATAIALATRAVAAAQTSTRRVAFMATAPRSPVTESFWDAAVSGLQERGWRESQNLVIVRRYVELHEDAARAAAEELVRVGAEVIVVANTLTALAAKRATSAVPIVMAVPSDPVAAGLVESLARPGGNVTGLSFVGTELAGKQVELLKDVVRRLSSVAVLANPLNASHAPRTKEIATAARALRLRVDAFEASSPPALGVAFGAMTRRRVGALVVLADPFFAREADHIIGLAAEHRLPAMYGLREAPLAGGLMSYGANFGEMFRRAAGYVDKILRGASPADLPIEQASRFELVINLKTAKSLGVVVPPSVLLRADTVID